MEGSKLQAKLQYCSTNFSPVIIKDKIRITKMMRWGLIPSWSKNDKISSKMINARVETILEKPVFSGLVKSNEVYCTSRWLL